MTTKLYKQDQSRDVYNYTYVYNYIDKSLDVVRNYSWTSQLHGIGLKVILIDYVNNKIEK